MKITDNLPMTMNTTVASCQTASLQLEGETLQLVLWDFNESCFQ